MLVDEHRQPIDQPRIVRRDVQEAAGPLGIMVVGAPDGPSYVLTGTVTLAALADAARRLPDLGSAG